MLSCTALCASLGLPCFYLLFLPSPFRRVFALVAFATWGFVGSGRFCFSRFHQLPLAAPLFRPDVFPPGFFSWVLFSWLWFARFLFLVSGRYGFFLGLGVGLAAPAGFWPLLLAFWFVFLASRCWLLLVRWCHGCSCRACSVAPPDSFWSSARRWLCFGLPALGLFRFCFVVRENGALLRLVRVRVLFRFPPAFFVPSMFVFARSAFPCPSSLLLCLCCLSFLPFFPLGPLPPFYLFSFRLRPIWAYFSPCFRGTFFFLCPSSFRVFSKFPPLPLG